MKRLQPQTNHKSTRPKIMMKNLFLTAQASALALGVFALTDSAAAETVTIQVGTPAGGAYDQAARLMAEHLPRHLGEDWNAVVQNQPGAASLNLARRVQNDSDEDVLAMVLPSVILNSLLDPESTLLDIEALNWIGSISGALSMCTATKASGIESVEDFATQTFRMGATSRTAGYYHLNAIVRSALDAQFEIVLGFQGQADIMAALERGELDASCGDSVAYFQTRSLAATRNVIAPYITPVEIDGVMYTPLVDYTKDPLDRAALELFSMRETLFFPIMMGPEVSAERVALFRGAFAAMVADPAYVAEATEIFLTPTPMDGVAVEEFVHSLVSVDQAVVDRLKENIQ